MRIKRNDGKFQMYVISAVDIQRIEGCTYSQAYCKMKKYDYFYINSRRYILASDYFTNGYLVSEAMYYSHLGEGVDTKVIKIRPAMYTVKDIMDIFSVGRPKAEKIMDVIPGAFMLDNVRYVYDRDFVDWLESLPNKHLNVA